MFRSRQHPCGVVHQKQQARLRQQTTPLHHCATVGRAYNELRALQTEIEPEDWHCRGGMSYGSPRNAAIAWRCWEMKVGTDQVVDVQPKDQPVGSYRWNQPVPGATGAWSVQGMNRGSSRPTGGKEEGKRSPSQVQLRCWSSS